MMKTVFIFCIAIACANGASLNQKRFMSKRYNEPNAKKGLENLIVNGEFTTIEEFPWTVSQQVYGGHSCGGSIISPTRGLTSAQCTNGLSIDASVWRAGSTNHNSGGIFVSTVNVITHPDFMNWNKHNDIAVIWYGEEISFSASISAIALPAQDAGVAAGSLATLIGWSTIELGSTYIPDNIQFGVVPIISCYDYTDDVICAGFPEGGVDACKGNVGSPLVHNFQLIGQLSTGYGCGTAGYRTAYNRVAHFTNWIHANL